MPDQDDYATTNKDSGREFPAPELPYRPRDPRAYRPKIGMIGCGGISESHLSNYHRVGYDVAALCDLIAARARKRQAQFYPEASVTMDYRDILARPDIAVVDIATHPEDRAPIIEAALLAGKHVLSQKPFVIDLEAGEKLIRLAEEQGVKLAVNQNGRWAPNFSYMREAVRAGLVGDVMSVHASVHWDHTWIAGTPFEEVEDVILYDFGIHWFDFLNTVLRGRDITRVQASRSRAAGQTARPAMLAQVIVEFEGGQASLVFDGHIKYGMRAETYVGGTSGALHSAGPDIGIQTVTLDTADGRAAPGLHGEWFKDGFHGSMAELLCAIEEDREPMNGARDNMRSLQICFAALAAARDGQPRRPGEVRKLS